MTAAVIKFPKQTIGKGGGVTARRELRESANGDHQQQPTRRVYNPHAPPSQGLGGDFVSSKKD